MYIPPTVCMSVGSAKYAPVVLPSSAAKQDMSVSPDMKYKPSWMHQTFRTLPLMEKQHPLPSIPIQRFDQGLGSEKKRFKYELKVTDCLGEALSFLLLKITSVCNGPWWHIAGTRATLYVVIALCQDHLWDLEMRSHKFNS